MRLLIMTYTIHALYKFVALPDFREVRDALYACCTEAGVIGTILLAEEGINGTIAGSEEGLAAVWEFLGADNRFADIVPKVSQAESLPFYRMKVRLKKEIVTMGVDGIDPSREVGTYVAPEEWNQLIQDPEVRLVDTRNDYEVSVGSFPGAENPQTNSFRDFPDYVQQELDPSRDRKVAMYCTGGIRCEKASAYLLQQGFEQVYHLQGGILKYLEDVPPEKSAWQGECFVFDNRTTVDHALQEGAWGQCYACRRPLREGDTESERYEQGVSCPACFDRTTEKQKSRARERERQMALAKARNERHLGQTLVDG